MSLDCWWGNPECENPDLDITLFKATLKEKYVEISWNVQISMQIEGINIWKTKSFENEFHKITQVPIPVNQQNGNYFLYDSNIESGNRYLYKPELVFRDGRSVMLDELSASTGEVEFLPENTCLHYIYPNPFNPLTQIRFQVGVNSSAEINLEVYNMLGQKVTTIEQGLLPPGEYTYEFNGYDDNGMKLSSGIYFVSLRQGALTETQKVTILK